MSTIDYMNECTVRDLVLMLMEERGLSLHEALDTVYNSETYAKLMDPATGRTPAGLQVLPVASGR